MTKRVDEYSVATPAGGDQLLGIDISDTTDSVNGTVKLFTVSSVRSPTLVLGESNTTRGRSVPVKSDFSYIGASNYLDAYVFNYMVDGVVDGFQYNSGTGQASGQFVRFTFNDVQCIGSVDMHCTLGPSASTDYPRSWVIQTSTTGAWGGEEVTVATNSAGAAGVLSTTIPAASGYSKYWQIKLTGSAGNFWRTNEFVFNQYATIVVGGLKYGQKVTLKNSGGTTLQARRLLERRDWIPFTATASGIASADITTPDGSTLLFTHTFTSAPSTSDYWSVL